MSNLWFNIRFGVRHWQWGPDGMSFRVNPAQVEWRDDTNQNSNWKELTRRLPKVNLLTVNQQELKTILSL